MLNPSLVYISSSCLAFPNVVDSVAAISKVSPNIELSGGSDYSPDLLAKLAEMKREKGLRFLIHGYFPPPETHFGLNFADCSARVRGFIGQTMNYVDVLDVPYYSTHSGFNKQYPVSNNEFVPVPGAAEFTWRDMEENIRWFVDAFPHKALAIENYFPSGGIIDCGFLMKVEDIERVLRAHPRLNLLLDLGHLKVAAHWLGFDYETSFRLLFQYFADRIIELHVSENHGVKDEHLPPDKESLQTSLICQLSDVINKKRINVTLETHAPLEEVKDAYERMLEGYRQ